MDRTNIHEVGFWDRMKGNEPGLVNAYEQSLKKLYDDFITDAEKMFGVTGDEAKKMFKLHYPEIPKYINKLKSAIEEKPAPAPTTTSPTTKPTTAASSPPTSPPASTPTTAATSSPAPAPASTPSSSPTPSPAPTTSTAPEKIKEFEFPTDELEKLQVGDAILINTLYYKITDIDKKDYVKTGSIVVDVKHEPSNKNFKIKLIPSKSSKTSPITTSPSAAPTSSPAAPAAPTTPASPATGAAKYTPSQELFLKRLEFVKNALLSKQHYAHDPRYSPDDEDSGEKTPAEKIATNIRRIPTKNYVLPLTVNGKNFVDDKTKSETKFYVGSDTNGREVVISIKDGKTRERRFLNIDIGTPKSSFNAANSYLGTFTKMESSTEDFKKLKNEITPLLKDVNVKRLGNEIFDELNKILDMRLNVSNQTAQLTEPKTGSTGSQEVPSASSDSRSKPKPTTAVEPSKKEEPEKLPTLPIKPTSKKKDDDEEKKIKENSFKNLSRMLF